MEDVKNWNFGYLRNYLEEEHETDPDFSNRASDILDAVEELKEENQSILDQWAESRRLTDKIISDLRYQVKNLSGSNMVDELNDKIMHLEAYLEDKDRDIAHFVKSLDYNKSEVSKLESEVENLKKDSKAKDDDLIECSKIINLKDAQIRDMKEELEKLRADKALEEQFKDRVVKTTAEVSKKLIVPIYEKPETDEDKLKKIYDFLDSNLGNRKITVE